jgi:hypothetical protein
MDLKEVGFEAVDWTHLAQDIDRWRALFQTRQRTLKFDKRLVNS